MEKCGKENVSSNDKTILQCPGFCSAGEYSSESVCIACAPGKVKAEAGAESCYVCSGAKVPNAAQTKCVACPSGLDCTGGIASACPAGKVCDQGVASSCEGPKAPNAAQTQCVRPICADRITLPISSIEVAKGPCKAENDSCSAGDETCLCTVYDEIHSSRESRWKCDTYHSLKGRCEYISCVSNGGGCDFGQCGENEVPAWRNQSNFMMDFIQPSSGW